MPKIRITAIPPGQAPEPIRRQWIGVVMETLGTADSGAVLRGAIDGVPDSNAPNAGGYRVSVEEALRALETLSPEAAQWWRNTLRPFPTSELVFKREACVLVP